MHARSIIVGPARRAIALAVAAALGLGVGTVAVVMGGNSNSGGSFYACLGGGTLSHVTLVTSGTQAKPSCPSGTHRISWSQNGQTGPQGPAGDSILSGQGAPAATLGHNGDYYLDVTYYRLYGPRTAGDWGLGESLTGARGAQGSGGAQGPQGVPGPKGDQGIPGTNGTNGAPGPVSGPLVWHIAVNGSPQLGQSSMDLPAGTLTIDTTSTLASFSGDISACTDFFVVTIDLGDQPGQEFSLASNHGSPLAEDLVHSHAVQTRTNPGPASWRASCAALPSGFLPVTFTVDVHFTVVPTFN